MRELILKERLEREARGLILLGRKMMASITLERGVGGNISLERRGVGSNWEEVHTYVGSTLAGK